MDTQHPEVIKLTPPPRPTKENIFGYNFGLRPYRKGGVRLERQIYKNKIFYHNYGHGGAGVSLSYGCARHIVELFTQDVTSGSIKEVAIIGCGYMGLMQSILLADLGYKVTVYSKEFPKQLGVYNGQPCITSQVAAGIWLPAGVDVKDRALHNRLGEVSFNYLKDCIEKKKYKGLSYKPVYMMRIENPIEQFCSPGLIETKEVKIDFGNGVQHSAIHFTTICLDGDIFLNELHDEARRKGVTFTERMFEDILDLCEIKEKYIFNCTGSYSRFLFNDANVVPIAGHILYLKKVPGVDYYLLAANKDESMKVDIYPQSDKLAVGLTYEERGWLDKPDPACFEKLARNLNEVLDWRVGGKPHPKL